MDAAKNVVVRVFLPLSIIFGLELLYRDPLFESTLRDVPLMQAKEKLRPLMQNVSLVGGMHANFLVVMTAINLMSKPAAFYFISSVLFVQYTTDALKSLYSHPRPFWVSDYI
jgi:hypothetical protein